MLNPPEGCPFAPRCEHCHEDLPAEDAAICGDWERIIVPHAGCVYRNAEKQQKGVEKNIEKTEVGSHE